MRINKYVARATGLSRRVADRLADSGQILVNGRPIKPGQEILSKDIVELDGKKLHLPETVTILFHKPVGYVCSRDGQGARTIYEILPEEYRQLKSIGRLDKDSSGLLLLTNDGDLTQKLTHPSYQKTKIYDVKLDKTLTTEDKLKIELGINLDDGVSKLGLIGDDKSWTVKMYEGRNRQIRRTFAALGYQVVNLHRTHFGDYQLGQLKTGQFKLANS